jgi:serine/threonine protein kinase
MESETNNLESQQLQQETQQPQQPPQQQQPQPPKKRGRRRKASTNSCALIAGNVMNNKYRVVQKIGKGAFCSVYRVYDIVSGEYFAAKVYKAGHSYRRYFDNELKLMLCIQKSCVEQNYIVKYIDHFGYLCYDEQYGKSTMHPCMVVELLGDSMYKLLDFVKDTDSPALSISTVKKVMREVLTGLRFLHGLGIIHADSSVDNLLTTKKIRDLESSKDIEIRISDFNSSTFSNKIFERHVGTRQYKSPEIILEQDFNEKTDIWSLGCIFFELLVGEYLFAFEDEESTSTDECSTVSTGSSSRSVKSGKLEKKGGDASLDANSSQVSSKDSRSHMTSTDDDSHEQWDEDYQHLMMIEQLLGKPPKEVYKNGRKYFNARGKLIHNPVVERVDLVSLLIERFEFKEADAKEIVEFLMLMLKWRPEERLSADELLKCAWIL